MNETTTLTGAGMDRRIHRPGARQRRIAIRVGLAVAVLLAAVLGWRLMPGAQSLTVDAGAISTGEVTRAAFQNYVPLRAEAAPLTTVYVTAVTGGQVASLAAGDGQAVAAGTPLARLTNPTLELEVATRSADIAGQLAGISAQRLAVERTRLDADQQAADAGNALAKAREDLRRKRVLLDRGIVNQAAVNPLEDEVGFQQRRVASLAKGGAEQAATLADQTHRIGGTEAELRESLAMARGSLSALTLKAPVAGRLTAFTLQPGQALKPGDAVGQIDSIGRWKLVADVDQFYLARVRPGLLATADLDGRAAPMHVIKVLPQVADGRFKVELGFDGTAPAGLNRGQTLDVRLRLGADRPALVAPTGGWLDAGGTSAFVLAADGRSAIRRAITTGRRNPDQVEVVAGLRPGERIVTAPIGTYAAFHTLLIR